MFIKNFKKLMVLLLVLTVSTSVFAAPRSYKVKSQGLTKTDEMQIRAFYHALLKEKAYRKKTNARKGKFIKTSFQPRSRNKAYQHRLDVTATAYTSHVNQTDSTPNIAAWGDRLYPGMKSIAVSRDLLNIYGLKHGQKVHIKGLKGEYTVLDKMNKRWRKKIDIYMGLNKRKAFQWGRRKVEIMWDDLK